MRTGMADPQDLIRVFLPSNDQRPEIRHLLFLHIQQAGTQRRTQPLMQRAAVIIAVQIGYAELKMRYGMGTIHTNLHPAGMRHIADLSDRQDLAGNIDDVRYQDQLRPGRNGIGIQRYDLFIRSRMVGNRYHLVDYAIAGRHMPQHLHDGAIILLRHDRFIPRLPVLARQYNIQRFRGIPRNGDLLSGTAHQLRQFSGHFLLILHRMIPHVPGPLVIHFPDMRNVFFQQRLWNEIVIPVLQIDVIRFQQVLPAYGQPERIVSRQLLRRMIGYRFKYCRQCLHTHGSTHSG